MYTFLHFCHLFLPCFSHFLPRLHNTVLSNTLNCQWTVAREEFRFCFASIVVFQCCYISICWLVAIILLFFRLLFVSYVIHRGFSSSHKTSLNVDCLSRILCVFLNSRLVFGRQTPKILKTLIPRAEFHPQTPIFEWLTAEFSTLFVQYVTISESGTLTFRHFFFHVTPTSGSFVTQNFDNTNDVTLLSCCLPYLLLAFTCLMLFPFLYVVRVLHVVRLFLHPCSFFKLFFLKM
jgi:hypothetical protein